MAARHIRQLRIPERFEHAATNWKQGFACSKARQPRSRKPSSSIQRCDGIPSKTMAAVAELLELVRQRKITLHEAACTGNAMLNQIMILAHPALGLRCRAVDKHEGEWWHSPTKTNTSDRYDVPIGGITSHVKDGCSRESLSTRQSSWQTSLVRARRQ